MTRVLPVLFVVFVSGGLLSGVLGLRTLTRLSQLRPVPVVPEVAVDSRSPTRTAQSNIPTTPVSRAAAPTSTPAVLAEGPAWWLLYVVGGDLWETDGTASAQLTHNGHLAQPALGDAGLAFIERSQNASDLWLAAPDEPPRAITKDTSSIVSQNRWASQPVLLSGEQRVYLLGDFNKSTTGAGDLAVWQVSLQKDSSIQITHPPAYAGGDQDVTPNPLDPQQIIFTRYAYVGTQLVEQLEWLDVTRGNLVPLTEPEMRSRQASYAPNATEVAFVQQGTGSEQDVFVAHIQVNNGRPVLTDIRQAASGMCANPVWSPDGGSLAYVALTTDQFQIWSVPVRRGADGSETFGAPHKITTGEGVDATSRPIYMTREQASEVRRWLAY